MKKKITLTMIISLFLAAAVQAQTAKSNFAGDWELDAVKSKLPETMQVDSMTLKVSQTEKELKVESVSKRAKGGARGGTQNIAYNLEGKETEVEVGSGTLAGKEIRKASVTADGKLNLNVTRNFNGETGNVTMKINEIWELLDEGKTLKVVRYMETPRGATNAELYFTRKSKEGVPVRIGESYQGAVSIESMENSAGVTPKKISGGVLNGKAVKLVTPEYPAAARAVRATGAVNVQVTIDEQGNVISASAVSGHPLLRQAAVTAARDSQFAPTMLQGVPVSVTGIIIYNFAP
jgi:TonB family protein